MDFLRSKWTILAGLAIAAIGEYIQYNGKEYEIDKKLDEKISKEIDKRFPKED